MSNPDFSQSPQHVALAKVLAAASHEYWFGVSVDADTHWGTLAARDKGMALAMANAAIDHLGSGYVLPAATEENAERLAKAHWNESGGIKFEAHGPLTKAQFAQTAMKYLCAMQAAFGDAEKPKPEMEEAARIAADPTFCRPGCDKPFAHPGRHSDEDARTYGEDKPSGSADYDGGPDFSAEAAERERERLTEAFMLALVGNPAVMAKFFDPRPTPAEAIAEAVAGMAQMLAQELIG